MIPLLSQCPSTPLKLTHSTDPGIKRFNSGTLKGLFLVFKKECLMQVKPGWGLGREERGWGRRREEIQKDI